MAPNKAARVTVLDRTQAARYGATGLAFQVARTDGVAPTAAPARVALRVPSRLLAGLYGANFASRVRWVQRPAATPGATPRTVAATPDAATQSLVLSPTLSAQPMVVTAAAAPTAANGTGSFAATPLSPSASWQVSTQTGDFSWSYPLRIPPAPAGPSPSLALSYDSGSVDGETGSTNNQPSAAGEGWSIGGAGFIERSYVPCSTDGMATSGDQCWKTDNATMSFAGHSGLLVRDTASGTWRLQADDGTRVEKLTGAANGGHNGEYWKVTTADGTQSFFGRAANSAWSVPVFGNNAGEPCNAATFAASACAQTWRWNLDYVVDTHGNAESFTYAPETNKYQQNGTAAVSYTRGGQLAEIDYGYRAGAGGAAPERVLFDAVDRCSTTTGCDSAHPANWPDVPWDQSCTGTSCPGQLSPTFWSTKAIAKIHPQLLSGTTYSDVDAWTLMHSFPATGDGTSPALWLSSIGHTGFAGSASIALPKVVFHGVQTQNRVWAVDGLAPLDKYRISSIDTETGATITVSYAPQQCSPTNLPVAPQSNAMRCFPQWFAPPTPPQPAKLDWFHKYVVTEVASDPRTGGTGDTALDTTFYDYTGTPGWRYDNSPLIPDAKRTWSGYAGYSSVRVRHGDQNAASQQLTTSYTFFQGLDGDRASPAGGVKSASIAASDGSSVADSRWLAGRVREETSYNGYGGPRLTNTITTTWASPVTADDGTHTARIVANADLVSYTALAAGGNRVSETKSSYDGYGRPTAVSDLGDTATSADDRCTRTTYATNSSAWILGTSADVETYGASCATTPSYPADAISHTRSYYDNSATLGSAPSTGNLTRAETTASYTGSAANWQVTSTASYDALGRPVAVTDPRTGTNRTTTTSYTPSTGPLTQTVVTNPLGWATTTAYNPARGTTTSVVDPNGHRTDASYDAMGRVTQVWLPNRGKAAFPTSPSIGYAYTVSASAPNAVATTTVNVAGATTSYALFDGLLRSRQMQGPSEGGGRVVTDTFYDNAGRASGVDNAYYATGNPAATLLIPSLSVPSSTETRYDGAGRKSAEILFGNNLEKWRTSYSYGGNYTSVTPPAGGTPTTTFTDARGQTTRLLQYHGSTPTGAADTTTYGYASRGDMTAMSDPAGNAWSWSFDALGRQVTARDPASGTSTTSYDAAGRVATTTDNAGNTLAYSYDTLDRKTDEYVGSTGGTRLASWTYDTLSKGQLTSSARHVGSDTYTTAVTGYNTADQPTGNTITIPASAGPLAGSYATSLYYGADGALTAQVDPAAGGLPSESLRYGYDSLGSPTGVSSASGSYLGGVTYTHLGQIAQTTQAQGGASVYNTDNWDPATGRLTEHLTQRVATSGAVVSDDTYTYDPAGNITADTNTVPAVGTDNQCFSYDYLQRLSVAWTPTSTPCTTAPSSTTIGGPAPYWSSYGYDLAGNRTTSTKHATSSSDTDTTDSYTYPTGGYLSGGTGGPNAVAAISHVTGGTTSTSSYTYNAIGATTGRPGQSLSYDRENQLATITAGGATESRIYDASGSLLLQTGGSGSTLYLGDTEVHLAPGAAATTGVRTYSAAGLALAERTTTAGVAGSHAVFLDANPQSTSTATIDTTSAQTVARRYFDPFGNSRGPSVTWPSDHGYLNAPTDALAGLTHLGAREYDPAIGRFLSADPVLAPTEPQSINGYAYADNNPVTKSDPSGRCDLAWYICQGQTSYLKSTPSASGHDGTHGGSGYGDSAPPPPGGGSSRESLPIIPGAGRAPSSGAGCSSAICRILSVGLRTGGPTKGQVTRPGLCLPTIPGATTSQCVNATATKQWDCGGYQCPASAARERQVNADQQADWDAYAAAHRPKRRNWVTASISGLSSAAAVLSGAANAVAVGCAAFGQLECTGPALVIADGAGMTSAALDVLDMGLTGDWNGDRLFVDGLTVVSFGESRMLARMFKSPWRSTLIVMGLGGMGLSGLALLIAVNEAGG